MNASGCGNKGQEKGLTGGKWVKEGSGKKYVACWLSSQEHLQSKSTFQYSYEGLGSNPNSENDILSEEVLIQKWVTHQ